MLLLMRLIEKQFISIILYYNFYAICLEKLGIENYLIAVQLFSKFNWFMIFIH